MSFKNIYSPKNFRGFERYASSLQTFLETQKEMIWTYVYVPWNPKPLPETFPWQIIRVQTFREWLRPSDMNSLNFPVSLSNIFWERFMRSRVLFLWDISVLLGFPRMLLHQSVPFPYIYSNSLYLLPPFPKTTKNFKSLSTRLSPQANLLLLLTTKLLERASCLLPLLSLLFSVLVPVSGHCPIFNQSPLLRFSNIGLNEMDFS